MTTKSKTTTTRKSKPRVVKTTAIPQLPKKPFVFEVLDLVSKQRSKAKNL